MSRGPPGSGPGRADDDCYFALPGSFADFYDRHYPRLIRYFARRVRDPEQALDLTADTFVIAFEKRDTFRGSSEPEALAWVFAIADSMAGQSFRKGAARRRLLERLRFRWPAATEQEIERVEEIIDAKATGTALEEALATLSPAERALVMEHVVEGRSCPEIVGPGAAETPDAARMRFTRSIDRLAAQLRGARQRERGDGEQK
jgi:RNA polymerase sigma-70 factor (ECF subfamily)